MRPGGRAGGEQALAKVLLIAELGRRYESGGRALVPRLRRAARGQGAGRSGGEASILGEGSDVRIMSVHWAKGLEFPVVVLADPTSASTAGRRAASSTRTAVCARCARRLAAPESPRPRGRGGGA